MESRLPYHSTATISLAAGFTALHTWAFVWRAYIWAAWIDIPIHIIFGACFAFALLYLTRLWGTRRLITVFSLVMLAGLLWELTEYGYDALFALPRGISLAQHGMFDSVTDVLANAIGAFAACLLFSTIAKSNTSSA